MSTKVYRLTFVICLLIASVIPYSKSSRIVPRFATTTTILPSGYIHYPNINAAFKVYHEQRNWSDAKKACINDGGRLAVIDTQEKVKYVKENKPKFTDAYVGITRDNAHWITADDHSPRPHLPWEPNQPDDFGDCAVVNVRGTGLSNKICIWKRFFVCEILIPPTVQLIQNII